SGGSDGAHPLPVTTYFARLSQRLIGAITAPTGEGRLYEVDMRLRPSGASGPIASSLAGFARYQQEAAWTWEHMALTRARPVAGGVPRLAGSTGAAAPCADAPDFTRRRGVRSPSLDRRRRRHPRALCRCG